MDPEINGQVRGAVPGTPYIEVEAVFHSLDSAFRNHGILYALRTVAAAPPNAFPRSGIPGCFPSKLAYRRFRIGDSLPHKHIPVYRQAAELTGLYRNKRPPGPSER
jgi:hypothetical protein